MSSNTSKAALGGEIASTLARQSYVNARPNQTNKVQNIKQSQTHQRQRQWHERNGRAYKLLLKQTPHFYFLFFSPQCNRSKLVIANADLNLITTVITVVVMSALFLLTVAVTLLLLVTAAALFLPGNM